jgi:hypothetical protein
MWPAFQALFDPTPGAQSSALSTIATNYTAWVASQQPNGNYINDEFEGDSSHAFIASQGSRTMTLSSGSPSASLPANYCGTVRTSTGTIAIASDRVTITGTGTNFSSINTGTDTIELAGTFNGQPWSMLSSIASVSGSTLVLGDPWRGDLTAGVSPSPVVWQVLSAIPLIGGGDWNIFFATTDAADDWNPLVIDTDNFYWCSQTDSTHILLDIPYSGNTSSNPYRRPTTQNLAGRGSQPFMQGIAAWSLHMNALAMATSNPTMSAGYTSLASAIAPWETNYGTSPNTHGLFYGAANFSNCRNLSILPAWQCAQYDNGATTGAQSIASNERSYLPEATNSYVWRYLSTLSPSDQAAGDAVYTRQWAVPGYASPFAGDGNFVGSAWASSGGNSNKLYGQVWGMGQGHQWPAARLGGVAPPDVETVYIPFNLSVIPEASQVRITITQPTGLTLTPAICATSPCTVTLDRRAGSSLIRIDYLNSSGSVIAPGESIPFYVP